LHILWLRGSGRDYVLEEVVIVPAEKGLWTIAVNQRRQVLEALQDLFSLMLSCDRSALPILVAPSEVVAGLLDLVEERERQRCFPLEVGAGARFIVVEEDLPYL